MIVVNNNDSGLCNRIKLMGQALAWGLEFNQDVTHNYFYDLKKYLNLDDSILPINVRLPYASNAKIWVHNQYKAIKRHLHFGQSETRENIRKRLADGRSVKINLWTVREPMGFIQYQKKIAKYLAPKEEYQIYADGIIKDIKDGRDVHLIALHMRRGDYKNWRGGKYYFDENNYIKWINDIVVEFGNNACVLLFTNEKFDIERARREVKYKDIYLMKGNAVQDLTTMSKCEYIVGPPSTYSEMAAYYGNAMYLNLYNKEQNIRLKEFKTLREIYEAYYNIEIDSDESERK